MGRGEARNVSKRKQTYKPVSMAQSAIEKKLAYKSMKNKRKDENESDRRSEAG